MMIFGQAIHNARKKKGWTCERLAKAIRSHKGYVSGIENGKVSPPSSKVIGRLARILDLPEPELQAVAWWEKRPDQVTPEEVFKIVDELIAGAKELRSATPPDAAPVKEAV